MKEAEWSSNALRILGAHECAWFFIPFQYMNGEFTNSKKKKKKFSSIKVALLWATSLLNVATTEHKLVKHFFPYCHVYI